MSQMELVPNERRQALESIRALFEELGRVPVRVLSEEAVKRGALPASVVYTCQQRGIAELCREALKQRVERGLPFAQPVGTDEDSPWTQLRMFNHAELSALIVRRWKGVTDDWEEVVKLRDYCVERFGTAPAIPEVDAGAVDAEAI